jgi:Family of unknown function (DUF5519)
MVDLRSELIERLGKLGVEHRPLPGRDDGFASLCYGGKAFAHFHNDNELDIRLTKAVIASDGLAHPTGSTVHPKRTKTSHWIEVRFTTHRQLDRVIRLVKLAIEQL